MAIQPPFSLADLLDGTQRASFTLHLSDRPLVKPYQLGTMQDATFKGYVAATLVTFVKKPEEQEAGLINGYGVFINEDKDNPASVQGAWITTPDPLGSGQDILVSVVHTFAAVIPPGTQTLQINLQSYVLAVS